MEGRGLEGLSRGRRAPGSHLSGPSRKCGSCGRSLGLVGLPLPAFQGHPVGLGSGKQPVITAVVYVV